MPGVTRVVLELVILRYCHDRLPDDSIQAGNLSRIVEVSLFKREHSQVPPMRGVILLFHRRFRELFDTDSESDASQSRQMPGRLKLPKPPGARAVSVRTKPQRRQHLAGVFASWGRLRQTFGIDDDVFGDALPRLAFDCPASPAIRVPAAHPTVFAPKQ
jgi:hypothetical protein